MKYKSSWGDRGDKIINGCFDTSNHQSLFAIVISFILFYNPWLWWLTRWGYINYKIICCWGLSRPNFTIVHVLFNCLSRSRLSINCKGHDVPIWCVEDDNCIIYIRPSKASRRLDICNAMSRCVDIERSGTVHTFFPPPPSLVQTSPGSQNHINISLVKKVSLARYAQ